MSHFPSSEAIFRLRGRTEGCTACKISHFPATDRYRVRQVADRTGIVSGQRDAGVDFEPPQGCGKSRNLDIAGLLTVTTSYRFSDHWFTRFNWNRVMSNDSRDSDNFLPGVGYRWARRSGDE